MGANKVKIGFFSFTEVLDDQHREYNEWHLFDHLPENLKLEGLQWGQRWVATPELMKRRSCAVGALAASQYVTLYLITEPVQKAIDDFYALGRELYEEGRWFHHRKSHLGGPFTVGETYVSPRLRFDADAIPYRPNRGVFVTVRTGRGGDVGIAKLLDRPGVAGCWSFDDSEGRTVHVYWLDDDPSVFLDNVHPDAPADGTLLAGAYQSIAWDSAFDWFD